MKISVIVPIYNTEKYLEQCLNSIMEQTYKDIEVVLINDGSTDKSGEICNKYCELDSRFSVIHQKNIGLSGSRNVGIKCSSSEYIYFVDSDDFIGENLINSFVNVLNANPNADFIIGRMTRYFEKSNEYKADNYIITNDLLVNKNGYETFNLIIQKYGFINLGVRGLYKRQFLINNNLFFTEGIFPEDEEWSVRLFCNAKIVRSNIEPLYYYRVGRPGSAVNTMNIKKVTDKIELYEKWYNLLNSSGVSNEFRSALTSETGRRYIEIFLRANVLLTHSDLIDFYKKIKTSKKILKGSNSNHNKAYWLITILGPSLAAKILNIYNIYIKMIKKIRRLLNNAI